MRKESASWSSILRKSDKISEQSFSSLFPESFRMPLDSQQRQGNMKQPFYDIVAGAAGADKSVSQAIDSLMVSRVDQGTVAVELIKEVLTVKCAVVDVMCLVFTGPFMAVCGINVLIDIAAEMNIDDLEAFADTKHRFFLCHKKGEGLKLQDV